MHLIAHRVNTIEDLRQTPKKYGVEVDVRSQGSQLIIHHDPFKQGEFFSDWIKFYEHDGPLILNVKEEGLEEEINRTLLIHQISDYFFLDQSFPFLIKTARLGNPRCSVRISEYESIETALSLAGQIEWAWIDFFSCFPLNYDDSEKLKKSGFKLCLVSPELQGYNAETAIRNLFALLTERRISADAVCTKHPVFWEKMISEEKLKIHANHA